ncbi:hypothetical protein [Pseudomonas sp. Marseille-P9899]|uniref:hypothetical protein n=1 Tax=Pseudomonas sp. Marseille-P9899 TaxID=2730401 RepID=UPI001588528C|nr:hypothetical protein [Pseudomonas sp. Marseille-P9899]
MKKIVPDPPPIVSIRPGVTHEEAVRQAAEFVHNAHKKTSLLPRQLIPEHQTLLSASIVEMEICRAYLKIAMARSTTAMPI